LRFLDREIADAAAELGDITQSKPFPEGSKDLARLVQRARERERPDRPNRPSPSATAMFRRRSIGRPTSSSCRRPCSKARAEFDEAIKLFAEAAKLLPEGSKVAEKLAALRSDWEKDRGPRHKEARKRLISTWPVLDPADLANHFVVMKDALDECKNTGDHLTPRRFVRASAEHLGKIKKAVDALKAQRLPDQEGPPRGVERSGRARSRIDESGGGVDEREVGVPPSVATSLLTCRSRDARRSGGAHRQINQFAATDLFERRDAGGTELVDHDRRGGHREAQGFGHRDAAGRGAVMRLAVTQSPAPTMSIGPRTG